MFLQWTDIILKLKNEYSMNDQYKAKQLFVYFKLKN